MAFRLEYFVIESLYRDAVKKAGDLVRHLQIIEHQVEEVELPEVEAAEELNKQLKEQLQHWQKISNATTSKRKSKSVDKRRCTTVEAPQPSEHIFLYDPEKNGFRAAGTDIFIGRMYDGWDAFFELKPETYQHAFGKTPAEAIVSLKGILKMGHEETYSVTPGEAESEIHSEE